MTPWRTLLLLLPGIPVLLGCANLAQAQEGLATYYTAASCRLEGTSGAWTASGERYNEMAFTAALPQRGFGHRYRVCRTEDRWAQETCVVVVHNDAGPGRRARARGVIIDLTPAAFDALGGQRGCGKRGCWGELAVTVEAVR